MKFIFYLFLSYLTLLVSGTPQFTTCPSSVCLSQPVTYECNSGSSLLEWIVLDTNGARFGDGVLYTASSHSVGRAGSIGGQFNTVLINNTNPLDANITFTPTLSISNYTVQCGDNSVSMSCSIMIADIPSDISGNITFYSNRLDFSWSLSNSTCLSHYNVNVTSIEYTINTTDTSLSLLIPLPNDTQYSISVVAVDTGGRYMDPQVIRFIPDVPQNVTNLALRQTSPDDEDDSVNITVSWNEPPVLMFLPVLSYIIYPNVTDPDSATVSNSTTTYNIPDATVGSVYTVGVAAVNVLGTGPTVSTTISIVSTVTVVPTSTSIPTSSTESTNMSSTFIEPSVMPSTSPAPTDDTSGLNSAVYIGIGAAAAVIAIIILILIIVGCVIWRKSKGEKDSTEPIALVNKKDPAPETGQPIYQEAMASEDIKREAAPTTGELYSQPTKSSIRRPPPSQPQAELATYQDPSTIQRTQAPNAEYLYAEVDKKQQQQPAVYAQVDKEKKGGDGTVYADLDLKNTSGPVSGNNPANVIYSDVNNN